MTTLNSLLDASRRNNVVEKNVSVRTLLLSTFHPKIRYRNSAVNPTGPELVAESVAPIRKCRSRFARYRRKIVVRVRRTTDRIGDGSANRRTRSLYGDRKRITR